MPIAIQCPKCQRKATVADNAVGITVKCGCGTRFLVQAPPKSEILDEPPQLRTASVQRQNASAWSIANKFLGALDRPKQNLRFTIRLVGGFVAGLSFLFIYVDGISGFLGTFRKLMFFTAAGGIAALIAARPLARLITPSAEKAVEQSVNAVVKIAVILILVCGLSYLLFLGPSGRYYLMLFGLSNPTNQSSSDSTATQPLASTSDDDLAIKCARAVVLDNLKAPSTASFFETRVLEHRNKHYLVFVAVDAQNSFGAMIRNKFVCCVELAGGDKYYVNNQFGIQSVDGALTPEFLGVIKKVNHWPE